MSSRRSTLSGRCGADLQLFKLVLVAAAGFCATKTAGFTTEVRRGYSTVVFQYFVPAVILANTAMSVDRVEDLLKWWWLPCACVMINVLSLASTRLVAFLFRLAPKTTRVFVYCIAFGNTVCFPPCPRHVPATHPKMYIPLALIAGISTETAMFDTDAANRGGAYVSAYLLLSTLIYWVYGYGYISKNADRPSATPADAPHPTEPTHPLDPSSAIEMTDTHTPPLEHDHPSDALVDPPTPPSRHEDAVDEDLLNVEPSPSRWSRWRRPVSRLLRTAAGSLRSLWNTLPQSLRQSIVNFFTPPTLATITGMLLIIAYPLRDVLFVSGPFSIIGRSVQYLGTAAVISALFILGGNLSSGPRSGTIPWYVVLTGLIFRLVLVPAVCVVVQTVLWWYGVLPDDPMFFFVVAIESSPPPSDPQLHPAGHQQLHRHQHRLPRGKRRGLLAALLVVHHLPPDPDGVAHGHPLHLPVQAIGCFTVVLIKTHARLGLPSTNCRRNLTPLENIRGL